MINHKRIKILSDFPKKSGTVVYWMQRDQRVHDNWALLYSQQTAMEKNVPLMVIFNLVPSFLGATIRHYGFMLRGISEVKKELERHNIKFVLLTGEPETSIPKFIKDVDASLLISDFNPLRIVRKWKKHVSQNINIPFHQVDAHNIVPCWVASNKLEFAAYTIRPKIHKYIPEFLDEFPPLKVMKNNISPSDKIDWNEIINSLKVDINVPEVNWLLPGENSALEILDNFIEEKLPDYSTRRNDPNAEGTSNLSPYLHFGHISAQRVALEIYKRTEYLQSQNEFLEELIVRRELSDNFCYYNTKYDSFDGFHDWAKQTLNVHRKDKRDFIYSLKEFENAGTHDDLWNAAQTEMVNKGKMHGYLRMYWAKKILEWTPSPEDALNTAIFLNDKYSLDGRDPNGYNGIAWSIGGVHDRAWSERNIFGKIRYMNYAGCKRKFDVFKYIKSPLHTKI